MTDAPLKPALLRARFAAAGIPLPLDDVSVERALAALTPTGPIRVALNMINPLLVRRDPDGGVTGIAPDMARAIGELLAREVTLHPLPTPAAIIAAIGTWDIAFMAMDRERAATLVSSDPYLRIGATFLIRSEATFKTSLDLDRPDVRIACPKGAAFAGWIRDHMVRATIDWDFQGDIGEALQRGEISAAAGLRASLQARVTPVSGLRLIDSDFASVEQAIAAPKGYDAGIRLVDSCLHCLRANGIAHGIVGRAAIPGISLA